jgi:hypothetical protein
MFSETIKEKFGYLWSLADNTFRGYFLVIFMVVSLGAVLSFDLSSRIVKDNCEILACHSQLGSWTIMISAAFLFLPTILASLTRSGAVVLLSIPFSFVYWMTISHYGLKAFRRISDYSSRIGNRLEEFFDTNQEKPDTADLVNEFLIPMVFVFSIFFGLISYLYHPKIEISITFSQLLIIATANTAITTYMFKVFESELNDEIKSAIRDISYYVLFFTLIGAFGVFTMNNKVGGLEKQGVQATLNFLSGMAISAALVGFVTMLMIPAVASSNKK